MSASNIAQFITFGSLIGRTFGFCMILLRIVFDCVGFRECVNVACLGDVLRFGVISALALLLLVVS